MPAQAKIDGGSAPSAPLTCHSRRRHEGGTTWWVGMLRKPMPGKRFKAMPGSLGKLAENAIILLTSMIYDTYCLAAPTIPADN
jgi:hypothetical protein